MIKYLHSQKFIYAGQTWFRQNDAFGPHPQLSPHNSTPRKATKVLPEARLARIARIKSAIADGSYSVPAAELAAKMIVAAIENLNG